MMIIFKEKKKKKSSKKLRKVLKEEMNSVVDKYLNGQLLKAYEEIEYIKNNLIEYDEDKSNQ